MQLSAFVCGVSGALSDCGWVIMGWMYAHTFHTVYVSLHQLRKVYDLHMTVLL